MPVLDMLVQSHYGVVRAMLTSRDSIKHSTSPVDRLGLLANLQALLRVATNVMATQNDYPLSLEIRGRRDRMILHRWKQTTLIVVAKNSVDEAEISQKVRKTAALLRTVLVTGSNLQDSWSIR